MPTAREEKAQNFQLHPYHALPLEERRRQCSEHPAVPPSANSATPERARSTTPYPAPAGMPEPPLPYPIATTRYEAQV